MANDIRQSGATNQATSESSLSLYYFDSCPFCAMVLSAVDQLGVDVEMRNIHADPAHRNDLIEARGRTTVPVLRISTPGEEDHWMPESRDIVRYLQNQAA